jgi:ABC-type multidrug transport system ATPase subunit
MVIKFECPQCAKQYQVSDEFSGKKTRCSCGCACTVPTAGVQPASGPPPLLTGEGPTSLGDANSSGLLGKVKKFVRRGQDVYESALQQAYRSDLPGAIPVQEQLVLGRDPGKCDYVLDHARVSRRHVRLVRTPEGCQVTDLFSADGTYVNGGRVIAAVPLMPGDRLNVGPYSFTFDGQVLVPAANANHAEILCNRVSKEVTDRATGDPIRILNDISLVVTPCEFTVIIGPSGGGKSTLLNALSGRQPATHGQVLLNGQNLYACFDALKKNMALVPQKDVLHQELGLRSALLYTARLRLPPDLGQQKYEAVVNEYLDTVDLRQRGETMIRDLSGGQVKRASLANEIISEPNLLFVDEATSGLDEHTDGEIMQIFRKIAEDGKTVVCITHNLTNVEKSCHKVVILAPGGYLAFVGTPEEARRYFQIKTLGDVYHRLQDKPALLWKAQFEKTETCQQMQQVIQTRVQGAQKQAESRRSQSLVQIVAIFFRQLVLLARRGLEIQLADKKSLIMMGVQCLFISMLICILFGNIPEESSIDPRVQQDRIEFASIVLFLLTISSFWFGCNNAAKEIVKEKEIYERERDVCLNVISYYAAKFLLLTVATAIQVGALLLVVNMVTGLPGNLVLQLASLVLVGVCGVATGLFISTVSSNTDMAVTLVPVAIIPQVILAGAIRAVDGLSELLARLFISCYWGHGNLMSTLPDAVKHPNFSEWSYLGSGILLVFHITVFVVAANMVLYAVDKRLSLKGTEVDQWVKNARQAFQGAIESVSNTPGAGN